MLLETIQRLLYGSLPARSLELWFWDGMGWAGRKNITRGLVITLLFLLYYFERMGSKE